MAGAKGWGHVRRIVRWVLIVTGAGITLLFILGAVLTFAFGTENRTEAFEAEPSPTPAVTAEATAIPEPARTATLEPSLGPTLPPKPAPTPKATPATAPQAVQAQPSGAQGEYGRLLDYPWAEVIPAGERRVYEFTLEDEIVSLDPIEYGKHYSLTDGWVVVSSHIDGNTGRVIFDAGSEGATVSNVRIIGWAVELPEDSYFLEGRRAEREMFLAQNPHLAAQDGAAAAKFAATVKAPRTAYDLEEAYTGDRSSAAVWDLEGRWSEIIARGHELSDEHAALATEMEAEDLDPEADTERVEYWVGRWGEMERKWAGHEQEWLGYADAWKAVISNPECGSADWWDAHLDLMEQTDSLLAQENYSDAEYYRLQREIVDLMRACE